MPMAPNGADATVRDTRTTTETAVDPSALLALATRVEGNGRYNLAKLLRAAAEAVVRRGADARLRDVAEGAELVRELGAIADTWSLVPLLAPLAPSLRRSIARLDIYIILGRYFIRGLLAGSVKG